MNQEQKYLLDEPLVDGKLPKRWYSKHIGELELPEREIQNMAYVSTVGTKEDQKNALEKMIRMYEEFKRKMYEKSECHRYYFQDAWERYYSDPEKDSEYIAPYREKYEQIKKQIG